MTPGTVVLLHGPLASAAAWADLPERLRSYDFDVIAPDLPDTEGLRYVARASLVVAATDPRPPLLLIAHGGAGPLLPAVAAAQRAAHRPVGGYLFMDAELPIPSRDPGTAEDWPDAPCGYLRISERHEDSARIAELRGWPVLRYDGTGLAEALRTLIDTVTA
jgi:pimeloyl-ACP methyl ester carboxylesterase